MAKAIHVYPTPEGDSFSCNLPAGSKVVRAEYAALQNSSGALVDRNMQPVTANAMTLVLFVLFDPAEEKREYSFRAVGDDCPIEEMDYCTSAFSPGHGFVHIFQSR